MGQVVLAWIKMLVGFFETQGTA